jgi:hypothetical protein
MRTNKPKVKIQGKIANQDLYIVLLVSSNNNDDEILYNKFIKKYGIPIRHYELESGTWADSKNQISNNQFVVPAKDLKGFCIC